MKKFFYIWNSDGMVTKVLQTDVMKIVGKEKVWFRIQDGVFSRLGYTPTASETDASIIGELKSSKNRTLVYFME